jgi:DNA-binding NarL/FixJ family response regulator
MLGALRAAGHDAELVSRPEAVRDRAADLLVVDLGSHAVDGIGLVSTLRAADRLAGVKTLGVYSHVHHDMRLRAEAAGYDLVVPRSRMAREGAALVERLTAPTDG